MYEICKVLKDNSNKNIYAVVAWTDLRTYAKTIADSLAILDSADYVVRYTEDIEVHAVK